MNERAGWVNSSKSDGERSIFRTKEPGQSETAWDCLWQFALVFRIMNMENNSHIYRLEIYFTNTMHEGMLRCRLNYIVANIETLY